MTASYYSPKQLDRFRSVQRLAYDCAQQVGDGLREGATEQEAAARLGDLLLSHGVRTYFHEPFAWFGDRTRFRRFRKSAHFFPSARRLELGMPVILDVAPIVDGYAADIGYAFSFGHNPVVEQGLRDLRGFRTLILERVRAGDTVGEIYRCVDERLFGLGYQNIHRKYPFGVLAHRVYRQPSHALAGVLGGRRVMGFGLSAALGLLAQEGAARLPLLGQRSPFVYTGPGSEEPPEAGLWAVEPHIARGEVGVKWEELLVIVKDDAYWLDDDLPHVRRWGPN